MLTFTDAAVKHIETMLKNKGEHAAFRLSIKETGCSGYMYVPEIVLNKKETDITLPVVDFIVYIDHDALPIMKGTTVDYVKKDFGFYQLVFNNPNAEGLCGCGESFKIKKRME